MTAPATSIDHPSPAVGFALREDSYRAHNGYADSDNAVHGDGAVALGFGAGLVPGITLLAYVAESLRAGAAAGWLDHGQLRLAYRRPVYDGTPVAVRLSPLVDGDADVRLDAGDGEACVLGSASLREEAYGGRRPRLRDVAPPDPRVEMAPQALVRTEELGTAVVAVTAESVRDDFARFGLDPEPYVRRARAPLASLAVSYFPFTDVSLRRVGPSVLVETDFLVIKPASLGARLTVRGRIDRLFSRRGNRYVSVEVGWFDETGAGVLWGLFTSIYELAPAPAL